MADLGGDQDLLCDLLATGMLREEPQRSALDDAVVIEIGGQLYLVSADGSDEPEKISVEELREFEINILTVTEQLRVLFALGGASVERVTPRLTFVGSRGQGARREAVYLAQGVSSRRALEDAALVLGHDPAPRHTILVPTERDIPVAVVRQVEAQDVRLVVLVDSLETAMASNLPPWASAEKAARLVIDTSGKVCKLDGQELNLTRRESAVLAELAGEAANEGGFVSRERIAGALENATGHDDRQDEQIEKVVSTLRKKLGPDTLIQMRRNLGYRLDAEPADIALF